MSLLVKICGLQKRRDVAAAVEAGAGAVGFVFARSVREIAPALARASSNLVPCDVKRVAVMLHPSNEEWIRVLDTFEPDVLQTDAADFDTLDVPYFVERWPVYREGISTPAGDGIFVYEGPKSGQGETVGWSAAAELAKSGKMILAGGLSVANIAGAVETVKPFGVDVSSTVESSPGEKDPELIKDFISAARAAEKNL
ncbi:MAG: phosphoribosylanthranilate isomerase [Gammaproteobacteria bacterium]|nr:phosphoribosylanthranilate isomerase [Gammaproteobacteria bacterium]